MKIQLLHSPVGLGHRSAAYGVAEALTATAPHASIAVDDVLAFAPRSFRYDRAWSLLQQHLGAPYDRFFAWADRPHPVFNGAREVVNLVLFAPLVAHLEATQPDWIVCTHYLPAIASSVLARAGRLRGRVAVVVTDYVAHRWWVMPGIDRYYVATRQVGQMLVERGGAASAIRITGIPFRADMETPRGPPPPLGQGPLRVLFLDSGVPRALAASTLASIRATPGLEVTTLDRVVPTLQPLIDRAHVVVTKAGGLVVTECLARGRAMVLPWPAYGQERGNRAQAVARGAAVALEEPSRIGLVLGDLARAPARVRRMTRAAARTTVGSAASRIASDLLDLETQQQLGVAS